LTKTYHGSRIAANLGTGTELWLQTGKMSSPVVSPLALDGC